MSLNNKTFQVVDTLDVSLFFKDQKTGEKHCYMSGQTSNANISVSTEKIEVQSGIGGQTTFSLNSQKTVEVETTVRMHDLELIALKNGVQLDKKGNASYVIGQPVVLTTGTGTLDKVKRILAIKNNDQAELKIVTEEPANASEIKVEIADGTVTFTADESVETIYVTAEVEAPSGKDNWSVVFYAGAFAKNCEALMNGIIYDEETSEIVGDIYYNFYNCSIDSDYSLEYGVNSPVEIPLKLKVLKSKYLPSGEFNKENKLGELVITER